MYRWHAWAAVSSAGLLITTATTAAATTATTTTKTNNGYDINHTSIRNTTNTASKSSSSSSHDQDDYSTTTTTTTTTTEIGSFMNGISYIFPTNHNKNSTSSTITTPAMTSSSSSSISTSSISSDSKHTTSTTMNMNTPIKTFKHKDHTTTTTTTTTTLNNNNSFPSKYIQIPQHYQHMRVSFVPLDLNSPLEEQHGGKFDAILHKMTEDILCKSQLGCISSASDGSSNTIIAAKDTVDHENEKEAMKRIQRLLKYKNDHPACCLVDHPLNVEHVMSRSIISQTLMNCLRGVRTQSGIHVYTPRYLELHHLNQQQQHQHGGSILKQIENVPFTYPLIIKPLTAAGTAESHRMGILLGPKGISKIQHTPCLIQEYANHDEKLYKVYVLGNKVWVFPRPSLPNLPMGDELKKMIDEGQLDEQYIDFDSQRPYPKLSDFGIKDKVEDDHRSNKKNGPQQQQQQQQQQQEPQDLQPIDKTISTSSVTSEEIRPIADCIRNAFGLELFGFDIIVTTTSLLSNNTNIATHQKEKKAMYVVDVNYFPSYKEVTNFSQLLAQYLAQCGIEGRVRSLTEW